MPAADGGHMAAALALAARTLGDTWPNPAVGCVLVAGDVVVGRGWTASGGRPHAEAIALERAGTAARGATAYVTLEPCSHHGKTPPCADALIAAGVARVVAAVSDPDPRVSGRGLTKLRAAGIAVDEALMQAEAARLNAGFFLRVSQNRPLFALKTATSLDGRIALASGKSQWITGLQARAAVQALRAEFDAILVGSGTAVADDPSLTCRLPGYAGRPKVRIVLDRRLRLSPGSRLAATAKDTPTWIVTDEINSHNRAKADALTAAGTDIISAGAGLAGDAFIAAAARRLAERGLTRVLVEGGGAVAAAFVRAGLIDRIAWFRAASLIGGDGRSAVDPLAATDLDRLGRFKRRETLALGDDILELLDAPAPLASPEKRTIL